MDDDNAAFLDFAEEDAQVFFSFYLLQPPKPPGAAPCAAGFTTCAALYFTPRVIGHLVQLVQLIRRDNLLRLLLECLIVLRLGFPLRRNAVKPPLQDHPATTAGLR